MNKNNLVYELLRFQNVNLKKYLFFFLDHWSLFDPTQICGIVEFEEEMGSSNLA